LTNHSQLFFLHSVISQFLTLTASSITVIAHCRQRIRSEYSQNSLIFYECKLSIIDVNNKLDFCCSQLS